MSQQVLLVVAMLMIIVWTSSASEEKAGSSCLVERENNRVIVTCKGPHIRAIPTDIPRTATHITFYNTSLVIVGGDEFINPMFGPYYVSKFRNFTKLHMITFARNILLEEFGAGAFNFIGPEKDIPLQNLFIQSSPKFTRVAPTAFGHIPLLDKLRIISCGLTHVPDLSWMTNNKDFLTEIDLSANQIQRISSGDFNLRASVGKLLLNQNPLREIGSDAFVTANDTGQKFYITEVTVKKCKELKKVDQHAFRGSKLVNLDLSGSSISSLPVTGLQFVEHLFLDNIFTLKVFPSVLNFFALRTVSLTYSHHCCAFDYVSIHEPSEFADFQDKCNNTSPDGTHLTTPMPRDEILAPTTTRLRAKRTNVRHSKQRKQSRRSDVAHRKRRSFGDAFGSWDESSDDFFGDAIPNDPKPRSNNSVPDGFGPMIDPDEGQPGEGGGILENGLWHTSTLDPNASHQDINAFCGVLTNLHDVQCTPEPDMFNPCEDIMGFMWLRVIVWFVVLTALVGNTLVLIVTLSSKHKISVSKFLMCNLAFADWVISVYLLLLASFDLKTMGSYFTRAITWQYDGGCQAAGFMAIFATCLSIFTLTMITLERWYAIRYAINLNKRLRLRQATTTMTFGWIFSLFMAAIPLVLEVSSYSKTSVCLPMKVDNAGDLTYIILILLINIAGFGMICFCYVDMYRQVSGDGHAYSNASRNDANIAKRMAILVFTDFVCLAPIAFFGLTAAAGVPLIDVTHSKILLVFFFPLNSCANPFLYAIFTKQFKKDLQGMMDRCGFHERRNYKYKPGHTSYPPSWSLHSRTSNAANHHIHRPSASSVQTTCLTDLTQKGSKTIISHMNNSPKITPTASPKSIRKVSPKLTPTTNGYKFVPTGDAVTSRTLERNAREARKLSVVPETSHNSEESSTHDSVDKLLNIQKSPSLPEDSGPSPYRKTVRSASQYEENSLHRRVAADYDAKNSSEWRKGSQATTLTNLSSVTEVSYATDTSVMSEDLLQYHGDKRPSDTDTLVPQDTEFNEDGDDEQHGEHFQTEEHSDLTMQKVKSWNANAKMSKIRGDSGLGDEIADRESHDCNSRTGLMSDSSSPSCSSYPRQISTEDDVFAKNTQKMNTYAEKPSAHDTIEEDTLLDPTCDRPEYTNM